MFLQKKYTKNVAKIYDCPESGERFGLIAINGDMKDKLLSKFQETFSLQGKHINNGGKASPLCIPALLASGGGSLGISAAASGTLFMATANPVTLMAIGNGVGSAVMGAGGIVAQAPFIPVAGAIMPVAAPLLAFQALSMIMMIQQFGNINERLCNVEKTINRVILRNEASYIGEIISAISRLDILEKELSVTNGFTNEMIIRLALIEDKVNPIFERYKYLYSAQKWNNEIKKEDVSFNQTDAYMSIVISILDLRIDVLRLKLTIQENPGFLNYLAENLVNKVSTYHQLWKDIENSPARIEQISESLINAISDMNWWQKNMPLWLGGKRSDRKEMEQRVNDFSSMNSDESTKSMLDAVRSANTIGKSLTEKIEPVTLLYWEDKAGKHSYYTNDIVIK